MRNKPEIVPQASQSLAREFQANPSEIFALEGGCAVFKELLLPTVEDGGLQTLFLAYLRYGLLLYKVTAQQRHLFLGGKMSAVFLHDFSFLVYTL